MRTTAFALPLALALLRAHRETTVTEMSAPRYLVGLDVEASGMGLRANFLTQIGLALVDVQHGRLVAKFSSYVAQPPNTTWERRCVDEFWSKHPEQYARVLDGVACAPPMEQVAQTLLAWVRTHATDPDATRLVVNTPGFDTAWLDFLLGDRSHLYLFEKNGEPMFADVLEVSSWYLGLAGVCDPDASSKEASRRAVGAAEEPTFEVAHDHDAANDAAHTALRAAWIIRELQRSV